MSSLSNHTAGDKPVLVEFFATWCPHCQRMMPIMEELKKRMGKKLKVVQLDIDSPANREAVGQYRVDSTPTFVLFSDGRQVWRDSGEYPLDELIAAIEGHI